MKIVKFVEGYTTSVIWFDNPKYLWMIYQRYNVISKIYIKRNNLVVGTTYFSFPFWIPFDAAEYLLDGRPMPSSGAWVEEGKFLVVKSRKTRL